MLTKRQTFGALHIPCWSFYIPIVIRYVAGHLRYILICVLGQRTKTKMKRVSEEVCVVFQ